ncbi:MAG: UDP-N-acetylglucosamine 2-epimerase (non-hydrolyzing) [Bacteroidales bacterium]|nr:UDP-N-acetylglucosamine 2-epimerase (non-hydrolyzing) [Bacteroidales bacterium]
MNKIISIIGARPQFIKAAALCRAIKQEFSTQLQHIIIHTGQHYDKNMSEVFFNELAIDPPAYHLDMHTENQIFPLQKAIQEISEVINKKKPDMIFVYGDTYSTLAGAMAAELCRVPFAHIEAGMRSFNDMPEEVNRVETDKRATVLFCSTQTAVNNLINEGLSLNTHKPFHPKNKKIYLSGDIMYDHALFFKNKIIPLSTPLKNSIKIAPSFALTTIHRKENTDDEKRLRNIIKGLLLIAEKKQHLIFPMHPRTKKMISLFLSLEEQQLFNSHPYIHSLNPVSYLEMMYLENKADIILTDSGGVQKEAYFYQKPCIIVRSETEWIEIVESKCGILSDDLPNSIYQAYMKYTENPPTAFPPVFGDGYTANFICNSIIELLKE